MLILPPSAGTLVFVRPIIRSYVRLFFLERGYSVGLFLPTVRRNAYQRGSDDHLEFRLGIP